MIRVEVQLPGQPSTSPTADAGAIAAATMSAAHAMAADYPDWQEWEVTARRGGARYDLRNATGGTMSFVLAVGPGAARIQVGQVVSVGYYDRDPARPFIWAAFGVANWGAVAALRLLLGRWTQSNQGPNQQGTGTQLPASAYLFDGGGAASWNFPNTNVGGVYEDGCVAFGLAWAYHSGEDAPAADRLVAAWPVKRSGVSLIDLAMGAYDRVTQAQVWQATWTVGASYPMAHNTSHAAKFFYDQVHRWGTMIPYPAESAPVIYSAKSATDLSSQTLAKPGLGANLFGPYLALPYTDDTIVSSTPAYVDGLLIRYDPHVINFDQTNLAQEVNILMRDGATGAFSGVANFSPRSQLGLNNPVTIPNSGAGGGTIIRNNEPIAARPTEGTDPPLFFIFASGRQGLSPADEQENARGWLYPTTYPTSALYFYSPGYPGPPWPDRVTSHSKAARTVRWSVTAAIGDGGFYEAAAKEITATIRNLSGVIFDTDAAAHFAANYVNYSGGYWWEPTMGTASTSGQWTSKTESDTPVGLAYANINLPDYEFFDQVAPIILPSQPNSSRISGLTGFFARHSSAHQWPAQMSNSTGGMTVEEPVEDQEQLTWFSVLEPVLVLYGGTITDSVGFNTFDSDPEHLTDVEVFEDTGPTYNIDGIGTSLGMKQRLKQWHQRRTACLWRTMLYGINDFSGIVSETDISQTFDSVPYSEAAIDGSPSGTEDGVELGDNVWKIIPFPGKDCVCVLRDLHADGYDHPPSPHLEVYRRSDNPMTKLATVPLGTQDLLSADIPSISALAGDREWNCYFLGPPRMKACYQEGGSEPLLAIMVHEFKRVDSSATSQQQRVTYHFIDLADPSSPIVDTNVWTSTAGGVGTGSSLPATNDAPTTAEWDTLIMTAAKSYWAKSSKIREKS